MKASTSTIPWWLRGGTEYCEFCCQFYVYEHGYFCVACDGPVCALCVVEIRGVILCRDCAEAEAEAGAEAGTGEG